MTTKLLRIKERARKNPKEEFNNLYHHLDEKLLLECHRNLNGKRAIGVDKVDKATYEANLKENLHDLRNKLRRHSYRPQPARRVYIPKGEGEKRPLGIPSYEDKIVQMGVSKILEQIYEEEFLDCSYGFRPHRSCHDALKELNRVIIEEKINYVVDVDIKGFFNNVNHKWMMEMISVKIKDPNIKRLITKFLKSGIMEEMRWEATTKGTPQGSVVSPILANIYLHYAIDLWFEKRVKRVCKGQAHIIRYCDDFVCCFQYKEEAYKFYYALKQRLEKFCLEVAESKTKIIEFGRFATSNRKERGLGKPETFDFLGFTHYCSKSKNGKFKVKRKTSRKKFREKVKKLNQWLKKVRHQYNIHEIFDRVKRILIGHFRYYGITDNYKSLERYKYIMIKLLYKWLNRRSQRRSLTVEKMKLYMKMNPLPNPKIYVNIMDFQFSKII